jgi:sulfur carrier protein
MRVLINQQAHELPNTATLADAVQAIQASGPFAAAVNLRFVPRSQYASTPLTEGDEIEIIAPVTGG